MLAQVMPLTLMAKAFTGEIVEEVRPGGGLSDIRKVGTVETRYGLVAILVDSEVWGDTTSYKGLTEGFSISDTRLSERIVRYAEDVQASIPWTKTLIIEVNRNDATTDIQKMLERLYFEGDPNDADTTRLAGIVVVGDVPLPVVNKEGHRFISMFPYTDFSDPSYILDASTNDFIRNKKASNLQADIWHGLIVPPESGESGMRMLAEYFDKNNKYHNEDEDFVNFDKKTYIGDYLTEGNTVNSVAYASYERFITHLEEFAYYRFTSALLTEMYAGMLTDIEAGDKIDNDGDGSVDEEAKNGKDEDGDGKIDEDIGDGFNGVDNDEDGKIDEDTGQDNNNDENLSLYDEKFADVPFYSDGQSDEDPTGDANGDGCPGVCGKDDNGNSVDHDKDGFPTGMEMIPGWKWNDGKVPWSTPKYVANNGVWSVISEGQSFDSDEEAGVFFKSFFTDEDYRDLYALGLVNKVDNSCYDSGGGYHPELDDDEDGFCDEDGSTETDSLTGCIYNDNDCDGTADEDPAGMKPAGLFDDLPDIQSKKVMDGLTSRYVEIFQNPIGVWNRVVDQTGRWATRQKDSEGNVINDYDSSVSLIAKKDEYTLNYLRAVNDNFESEINAMAEKLQKEIPIIAYMRLSGTVTLEAADEDSEPETVEFCDPNKGDTDCAIFVNHSTSDESTENIWTSAFRPNENNFYMFGRPLTEVKSVGECSNVGGTYEEDGQFVQYNSLYSTATAQVDDANEIKKYKGCTIANAANYLLNEDPVEMCYPAVAEADTALHDGAIAFEGDIQDAFGRYEQGWQACYEFREVDTYQIYHKVTRQFRDALDGFAKSDEGSLSQEEYDAKIQEFIANTSDPHVNSATLRKGFDEIALYSDYTIADLLNDAGYGTGLSDDEADLIMAFEDEIKISNPMSGVDEIDVKIDKRYLNEARSTFTEDSGEAATMNSVYKYVEPSNDTLNLQYAAGGTPNLPVDATRRVSFMDKDHKGRVLKYINLFDADTVDEVEAQIETLASSMDEVKGGSSYAGQIRKFMYDLNEEQLQDALDWYRMNIDEKHSYLFSHYLGTEDPIAAKARDGYEVATIIADGTPTKMYFSFNGAKPTEDGDLEWTYRSQEAIDAALSADAAAESGNYESLNAAVSNLVPIPLDEWMDEILAWLGDVKDSVSSAGTFEGGEYCASESTDFAAVAAGNNSDSDGSGVPDVADETSSIKLTSEDNNVLQAKGKDYYTVIASARKADGSANGEDSFTKVKLEITSGSSSVEISGNDTIQLTSGVATFLVKSKDAGIFTVKAEPDNRDDLKDSNSLSGTVTSKFVKVTTYTLSAAETSSGSSGAGENIDVTDYEKNVVAVLNTSTGDLTLDGAEAKLLEATKETPTRIAIESGTGTIYGVFYLIPDNKSVSIGEGATGVYVKKTADGTEAVKGSDGVRLEYEGKQIGLVSDLGQIAVADGFYLQFKNPGQINIFDPVLITDAGGNELFNVTIKTNSGTVNLIKPAGTYKQYLRTTYIWPVPKKGRIARDANTAYASVTIPDKDSDGLDDLEEWTIGTDLGIADTDEDGYADGAEVLAGYSPLTTGALFSDLNAADESFGDVVKLYLRGVIRGYADGSFRPNNNLTREEFLQVDLGGICVRCQDFSNEYKNELITKYNGDPFPDADINPELLYCVAEGKTRDIVSGYAGGADEGYFVPKQYISRAEATKVLVQTAGFTVGEAGYGEAWYAPYVRAAQKNQIFPDGRFENDEAIAGQFKTWLEGYISRAEFAMMAANLIETQDCRTMDEDGDGLSDTEEDLIYGTDKNNADTDGGGVNDFDEVVRGSDPNDKSDDVLAEMTAETPSETFDLSGFDHESGVYGVGTGMNYETVSSSLGLSSSSVKVFTDLVAADGESQIFVQAEIRDQENNVYVDDNSSVIKFVLSSDENAVIASKQVKVSGGKAETILTAKTLSGELNISAEISDGSLPSQDTLVKVFPGEPVKVSVTAESTVIPSGGESLDEIRVSLYDSFNNLANYGFHSVTIESEGDIALLDLYDEDEESDGYQVTTSEGYIDFRIKSAPSEGASIIKASLLDNPDSAGSQLEIMSLSGMEIQLKTAQAYMVAGSGASQVVAVRVTDSENKVVDGFQGEVDLTFSDPKFGTFENEKIKLSDGGGTVNLTVGTLAGNAGLLVSSPGMSAGSATMIVKPSDPYEIKLRKEDGGTVLEAGQKDTFYADIYDVYGNMVTNDSSTLIALRKTGVTDDYGKIAGSPATTKNGTATFQVTAADISGKLNLVASSSGLISGSFGGDVNYSMDSSDFAVINNQSLYTNMLGAAYGDVTQSGYLGGYMTFNGKAEVVSTLIAAPKPKKELASIDSSGKINLLDGDIISQTVAGAGKNLPVRITWRSFPDDVLKAQIFYVAPSSTNSVSAELLSADEDFELAQNGADIYLRENEAGVVKVRSDGQIELLDSGYGMAVNESAGALSFVILKATEQVMRVDFASAWTKDATLLGPAFDIENYGSLSPGIYVIPTAADSGNFVAVPSGNSSAEPMGLALSDPEEDLPENQRPSLSYDSLDKAADNGTIGWEGDNKSILLFAAGNSAGDSNKYYASEVGVLLGDPSVRLDRDNAQNAAGFTEDIGKMIYANDKEIKSLLNVDYNGDNLPDVLTVYEDGEIDVLQNSKSADRLNKRGVILKVENGINSVDKGDFNGDELDDLLIATKTSCLAEEMCLYIYENIGGGFVAHNLTLSDITSKPKQVKVADLNADGYSEIVVLDVNLNLYIVWNNKGELTDVELVNNFGLNGNGGENLYGDLGITYDGLKASALSLTIPSSDVQGQSYLDDLLENADYSVTNSDIPGAAQADFEFADKLTDVLTASKILSDDGGGQIEVGDSLTYTISLKNVSGSALRNVYVSDTVSSLFSFSDSVECASCSSSTISKTGDSARPWVYGPVTISSGATTTLSYKVTVDDLPGMSLMVGNDLFSDYVNDDYPDIGLSPEGNTTGTVIVYYSSGVDSSTGYKKVNYVEKKYSGSAAEAETPSTVTSEEIDLKDENGNNIPDAFEEMDEDKGIKKTASNEYLMEKVLGAKDKDGDGWYAQDEMFADTTDADADGLNDNVDQWVVSTAGVAAYLLNPEQQLADLENTINALDTYVQQASTVIEEIASTFFCNGGCLAVPSNIAFLVPGDFHDPLTGTTISPPDRGIPIFGILPTPVPPVVCFGVACYASKTFRFYIAPTTTLGLGIALCVFPYGDSGQCFAFTLPLLQMLGVCDAINGAISKALSTATSFTVSGDTKLFNASITASAGGDGGISSGVFDGYSPPIVTSSNIQVPGFPSVFTEWWKKQKYEFFKMLDLPDITFIYPDPASLKNAIKPDPSQPELTLQTNILGLQKWLSIANSLPIIDITSKRVDIKYPAMTPEEIELIRKDWEQWLVDAKAEWERFKAEWKPKLSSNLFAELESEFNKLQSTMENNLAILEDYSHIPEQILKIRYLQAYYAKVVICYLDAVLSYTAGYLSTNAQRIKAWGEWVGQLKNIVKGWQAIIDLSVDFTKSCDKCTNQRFSAFQIIANLFVFLPEIPVIALPKWPDIVIDVSNIQAGVNIDWPDIKFVPEPIHIPKIPRLSLPSGGLSLDLNFNIDFTLPTLPEIDLNFELPELPGLALPTLPDLPPPPALPKIDATLKAGLDIVSTVLKIICLIRSNFFPIPETKLKTKIEEMTERPSNYVLPVDIAVTVQFPKISFDFLKRIDIKTYLNIKPDISVLYDLVKIIADKSNVFVSDIVEEMNKVGSDISGAVQSNMDSVGDINVEVETEAEVDLQLYLPGDPAEDVAMQYKDNPLVAGNLAALKNTFERLSQQLKNWDAATPDKYELKATERILAEDDPLLQRYDEIIKSNLKLDSTFLASIKDSPLSNVATIRDKMIASVENLDAGTRKLENMGGESFNKYLAMENEVDQYTLASSRDGDVSSGDDFDVLSKVDENKAIPVELSEESSAAETQTYNEGIYIYNAELAVSQKLIKYNQEADSAISLLMFDLDNDGDKDIIYSMGGNVYIKENYSKKASVKYVGSSPEVYSLDDLRPAAANVKNFETGDNSYKKAAFAFDAAGGAFGYEIILYDSLDAQEADPDENVKRLLVLAKTENEDESAEPASRKSRIYASDVSGDAKLYKAFKRTEIDADGEISVDDAVRFQTLEDSNIEIKEGGQTLNYEVPALYTVDFPRGSGRVIRVESGKVLWVDLNETVDGLDLSAGMELYKGEQLLLNGSAKATITTTEGINIDLDKEELFVMDELDSATSPNVEVELENGAYYTNVIALTDAGLSTVSDNILLNPQICGDDSAPYPILNDSEIDVPIFTTATLSAENSFDSTSEIGTAYWDADDTVDGDADGVANNDKDLSGLTVTVGPYSDIKVRTVTLMIADVAGNTSTATVKVNVFVPDLQIASATSEEVKGSTEPASAGIPFSLIREREGVLKELGDGYETDESGDFLVDDLNASDLVDVYNQNQDVIAAFNPKTKQLLVYDEKYEVLALPSSDTWPSRLAVAEKSTGIIMGSFLIISDSSGGITEVSQDLDNLDLSAQRNVTVHVLRNESFYQVSSDGFAAKDEFKVNQMLIRKNGNITMYNSDFELKKREADSLDEYLILDLYYKGEKEVEFFLGAPDTVTITDNVDLGLPLSESLIAASVTVEESAKQVFEDITSSDPLFDDIWKMVERGILSGYDVNGKKYFYPDKDITRAEFTKIILAILCIIPSDEAKIAPAVFNDITKTGDWFFPYTKESFVRDLITGYLGETDANGLAPFKPNNTITRAEAAKIMLEALDKQGIIKLPDDLSDEPWYTPYIEIAQDLNPYLTGENSGGSSNYILTAEEAANPSYVVTRYEFVEMSVRALQAYNCYDTDSDGDNLTDYEEENTYKTDSLNPDTDGGGINDGDEVERKSDPLDPADDFPEGPGLDLEPGVYAVKEACNSCPCYSSIDFDGDLQNGDKVFAIIEDEDGAVLGKSNTIEITVE